MVFLGIEQNSSGDESYVLDYCAQFGWDFQVGRSSTPVNLFGLYSTDHHNYFVIGRDGNIKFRAESGFYTGAAWSTYEPRIKQAIDAALAVPVEPTTWSGIKQLFR